MVDESDAKVQLVGFSIFKAFERTACEGKNPRARRRKL